MVYPKYSDHSLQEEEDDSLPELSAAPTEIYLSPPDSPSLWTAYDGSMVTGLGFDWLMRLSKGLGEVNVKRRTLGQAEGGFEENKPSSEDDGVSTDMPSNCEIPTDTPAANAACGTADAVVRNFEEFLVFELPHFGTSPGPTPPHTPPPEVRQLALACSKAI